MVVENDTDRQCQEVFDHPAEPTAAKQPVLPEHALFHKLRKYEITGYCNILRAFIGQGLQMDASRLSTHCVAQLVLGVR